MTIKRFEDIETWQLARHEGLNRDFSIKDQIFCSSRAVMDNIAEGFDAGSTAEFIRFLNYAKRSATEVQSQLYRILDRNYRDKDAFDEVYRHAALVRAKIGKFILYLESIKAASNKPLSCSKKQRPLKCKSTDHSTISTSFDRCQRPSSV